MQQTSPSATHQFSPIGKQSHPSITWNSRNTVHPGKRVLQGPKNTPFAIRNLLGWTITGPIKFGHEEQQRTNFLSLSYEAFDREMTLTTNEEDPLADYITSFWKIDSSGTENENETSVKR